MKVKDAKAISREWVQQEARNTSGFCGAFFHGSINSLPDDADLSLTSDVDIMVAVEQPQPPPKLGKFVYRDVLLEVSYLPWEELQSAESILSQYHLAGSFRFPSVILDPSGKLQRIQKRVACDFAKRHWVIKRCQHAHDKVANSRLNTDSFPDQVISWLFPAAVTTHVLLVAGLRNPTVRRRYVAVKELLVEYGLLNLYPSLLELIGCAGLGRSDVERHLRVLTKAFDEAKQIICTPFSFASDISDASRPIAIDGSWEFIEKGNHREAIFWIAATYARCMKVFAADGSEELYRKHEPGFREMLADLGIESSSDLKQGHAQTKKLLPRVWEAAEEIMKRNPEIQN